MASLAGPLHLEKGGCALIGPEVTDIALLCAVGFIANAATTFQDVAVDGLAVDIMQEEERARTSGMMFGGQMIGMSAATALTGAAIAAYGPAAAYLVWALLIGLVTLFVVANLVVISIMLTVRFPARQIDGEVAGMSPRPDGPMPVLN